MNNYDLEVPGHQIDPSPGTIFSNFAILKAPAGRSRLWKIHVSATSHTAQVTLDIIVALANEFDFSFKFVSNTYELAKLNDGQFGLSQIGKFITIYPISNFHLCEIVQQLVERLPIMKAPRVPYDCKLSEHPNVFLRYGALHYLPLRDKIGSLSPGWQDLDGIISPDDRKSTPPTVELEELHRLGVKVEPFDKAKIKIIDNRYIPTDLIHQGPRGSIFIGVDTHSLTEVVIKSANALDRISERDGLGAIDRLDIEYKALAICSSLELAPKPLFFEKDTENASLVMEKIEGKSIQSIVQDKVLRCEPLDMEFAVKCIFELRQTISKLNKVGIHHGDLSPRNIFLSQNGMILLDFEHAVFFEQVENGVWASGTPGYAMEPEHVSDLEALKSRVEYSVASLFYFLSTGAEKPSNADAVAPSFRWITEVQPVDVDDQEILQSLKAENGIKSSPQFSHTSSDAVSVYDGLAGGIYAKSVFSKNALMAEKDVLAKSLFEKLYQSPLHPGFFVGALGIAHVLRVCLGAPELSKIVEIDAMDLKNESPDLLNGRAGQLRYFCGKYTATNDPDALQSALSLANQLCSEYNPSCAGWKMPDGYGDLSGHAHVGYSHGACGIADCLLDYHRLTDCAECIDIVRNFEGKLSERFLIRGGTWTWPEGGRDGGGASWCHGVVGIGYFYLSFSDIEPSKSIRVIDAIVNYLYVRARWQGECFCHGLAGTLDFIVSVYRKFGNESYRAYAEEIALQIASVRFSEDIFSTSLFTGDLGGLVAKEKFASRVHFDFLRLS